MEHNKYFEEVLNIFDADEVIYYVGHLQQMMPVDLWLEIYGQTTAPDKIKFIKWKN